MAKTYRVKLSAKEAGRMEQAAELDGLTPADWLRGAIATRANGSINRARQRGDEVPTAPDAPAATIEVGAGATPRQTPNPPSPTGKASPSMAASQPAKPPVSVRVKRRRRPMLPPNGPQA